MNEEFDVVRWRRENPMDYLRAMEIIRSCSDTKERNRVFECLYRITRLHVPGTLYKFFSFTDNRQLNTKKLETLERQKVYMSEVKHLNDPFDSRTYYYDPARLASMDRLAPFEGRLIDDFSAFVRVCSLSANDYTSLPMWAHYANNHCGFCVSYDTTIKENRALAGCTFPVQYTDKRVDLTDFMEQQTLHIVSQIERQSAHGIERIVIEDLSMVFMASLFCNIKHEKWAYENEYRCVIGATTGEPYISAAPKEVYVGRNCAGEHTTAIVKISRALNVPVYRTLLDDLSPTFTLSRVPM